jgi:hypothetical protein
MDKKLIMPSFKLNENPVDWDSPEMLKKRQEICDAIIQERNEQDLKEFNRIYAIARASKIS